MFYSKYVALLPHAEQQRQIKKSNIKFLHKCKNKMYRSLLFIYGTCLKCQICLRKLILHLDMAGIKYLFYTKLYRFGMYRFIFVLD